MKYISSVILLVFFSLQSHASILTVPEQFHSIQEAIDESNPLDTILCAPGDYFECLHIEEHAVTLASEFILSGDSTFVTSTRLHPSLSEAQRRVVQVIGPFDGTISIVGLTIRDGFVDYTDRLWVGGAGLYAREVEIRLEANHFLADTAEYGAAIRLDSCSTVMIGNRVAHNISLPWYQGGVRSYYGTLHLVDNLIEFNLGSAVSANRTTSTHFIRNTIRNNIGFSDSGGLYVSGNFLPEDETASCRIVNNVIQGNSSSEGGGTRIVLVDTVLIQCNQYLENVASLQSQSTGYGGAIQVVQADSCLIQENLFLSNRARLKGGAIEIMTNATLKENQFIDNRAGLIGCASINRSGGNYPQLIFERNLFHQNGVWLDSPEAVDYEASIKGYNETTLVFHQSDFLGQEGNVLAPSSSNSVLDAAGNFWGDESGPFHSVLNSGGLGDTVAATEFIPWSTEHFWAANVEPDTNLVDFGMVEQGETVSRTMLLTNTGVETLVVRGGILEDPFFSLDLGADSLVLASEEVAEVTVRFAAGNSEAHLDTLRFDCNDPEAFRETVELRANVSDALPDYPDHSDLPIRFDLAPAQPNPFNPSTLINVALPRSGPLRVEVVNLLGRRVALLQDGTLPAGYHRFTFDGSSLTSGLYIIRATSPQFGTRLQKTLLLK